MFSWSCSTSWKITWTSYDLPFLLERLKIEVEKVVPNLHDNTEYVIHIRNLKQALNNGLVLKKVHRVIKSNQNACLKPCIDINTGLKEKQKIILKMTVLSWWIMQFLEKLWKMWEKNETLNLS